MELKSDLEQFKDATIFCDAKHMREIFARSPNVIENFDQRYFDRRFLTASAKNNIDAMEFLVTKCNANINGNGTDIKPILHASARGSFEAVKWIIDHGGEVNFGNGCTALSSAAEDGYVEIVRILIDNGADLNGHKFRKETPLDLAMARGHMEIVELLEDAEAQKNGLGSVS